MAKQRLIEQSVVSVKDIKRIPFSESTSSEFPKEIQEALKEKGQVVTSAYEFPVWRLDKKNLNGRIYTTELAKKLITEGHVTYALMDHPKDEEDGNPVNIWAIARDPHLKEGILYANAYLVGEYGKGLVQDILNTPGGKIGLSSSALGELDSESKIVVDTFELERYFDFVLNPSYEVWGTADGTDPVLPIEHSEMAEKVTESNDLEEKKENSMATPAYSKLEEKSIFSSISGKIKEIESEQDLKKKVSESKEVLSWFDGEVPESINPLKENLEKILKESEEKIIELAGKGSDFDSLEEDFDSLMTDHEKLEKSYKNLKKEYNILAEKYKCSVEMMDALKAHSLKMKELFKIERAKSNGMIEASVYREAQIYIDSLKEKIKELSKSRVKEGSPEGVVSFYENLLKNNPAVKMVKNEILKCKSVSEARITYMNLKDLLEFYSEEKGMSHIKEDEIEIDEDDFIDNNGREQLYDEGESEDSEEKECSDRKSAKESVTESINKTPKTFIGGKRNSNLHSTWV